MSKAGVSSYIFFDSLMQSTKFDLVRDKTFLSHILISDIWREKSV